MTEDIVAHMDQSTTMNLKNFLQGLKPFLIAVHVRAEALTP